jgi:hypothetical protein
MKLDKTDLGRINELWEDVINPECLRFEKETGKPAELFREALAGVFERRVSTTHPWNAWQRVWWSEMGKIEDTGLLGTSISGVLLRSP